MEGTLEDIPVKDPSPEDPDNLLTDLAIPNGMNGLMEEHREDGSMETGSEPEEEEEGKQEEDQDAVKGDEQGEEEEEEGSSDESEIQTRTTDSDDDDRTIELPIEVDERWERERKDYEYARKNPPNNSDPENHSKKVLDTNLSASKTKNRKRRPTDSDDDDRTIELPIEVDERWEREREDYEYARKNPPNNSDPENPSKKVLDTNLLASKTSEASNCGSSVKSNPEEEEGEAEEMAEEDPEMEKMQENSEILMDNLEDDLEEGEKHGKMDVEGENSDVECLSSSIIELDQETENPDRQDSSKDISGSSDSIEQISIEETPTKTPENGNLASPDIEIMDTSRANGISMDISLQGHGKDTPKGKKVRKQLDLSNITPRRSSRNIKRTSYIEKEPEEEPEAEGNSDIEEIKPEDPLACVVDSKDKENSKLKSPVKNMIKTQTIVVNDTKRLVEIAAGSKSTKGGKKEPTLVIIDTNSILSGRGGIPVSSSSSSSIYGQKSSQSSHNHPQQHYQHPQSHSSGFSVLPLGHTQTMYPNMRTTITPVPMTSSRSHQAQKSVSTPPTPQILPTLTDDMFVVEAPSFIVPYVYEKPPLKPLKEFVEKLEKKICEFEKEEAEERKRKKKAREEKKKAQEGLSSPQEEQLEEDDDEDEDSDSNWPSQRKDPVDTVDLTERGGSLGDEKVEEKNKTATYFDLPLGKFFMQIGVNLVQEFVQTDLLRTQKRKQGKHGTASAETQLAINSLIKNLEFSKENNEPFHLEMKKCEFCSFKTESSLVMQHHLETPHMRNYAYKCNFCPLEVRSPHDILFHMEAEHNTRGRLERGPAFHQCPNCPFEDNQKGKLTRHILACAKKFRPEKNLEPASDWEAPAKIPRSYRPRQVSPVNSNALAMAMAKGAQPLLPKLLPAPLIGRGRGRPPMQPRYNDIKSLRPATGTPIRQDVSSIMYRPTSSGLLVPTSYQFGSNQIFQVVGGSGTVNVINSQTRLSSSFSSSSSSSSSQNTASPKNPAAKLMSQPSISITPLPRTSSQTPVPGSGSATKPGSKNTFVICEICDGYIKDLEQLRNHMQWIHKVKIHPKMIYNRPPLNCQKCQFRFFTDQGLERHLLGSHGLVTSSMQEAANRGKDAGRCPACGRVYQWKLLNHVARDHGMTLKPAHLSYKCTVCTATFGMYKQFENHVYSAHSVVAKKVMDKKNVPASPSSRSNDSLLKPLKINDEITIIPQPAKSASRSSQGRGK